MTQARNYKGNVVATTLNGAINASTTSVSLSDGSTYPSNNFWIVVDRDLATEEKMYVVVRSTNVLTVIRGGDSTTAQSHALSAPVEHVLVASDIQQLNDHATNVALDDHTQYLLKTDAASTYGVKRLNVVGVVTPGASTTSSTPDDLAGSPGPTVTVVVPASGCVRISLSVALGTSAANVYAQAGFVMSGANTSTYDNTHQLHAASGVGSLAIHTGASWYFAGLAPGSTTFTAKYLRGGGAGTADFSQRQLSVETLP